MRKGHANGFSIPRPAWGMLLGLALVLAAAPARAGGDHRAGADAPPPAAAPAAEDSIRITGRLTGANAVGLAFYNNGFFGNNMASRGASLEYPLGTEEEHLVRAGLWIGGLYGEEGSIETADTLCTTATVDGYFGTSDREAESEFYPAYTTIRERSTLLESPFYDPDSAKSEQDLTCEYYDTHTHGSTLHRPLHVRVKQEILQFSFEPFDAIVLLNFYIVNNHPTNPIYDLYAGFYGEFASGWKGKSDAWPPTGWFGKKDIAYVDSLRLTTEHHYTLDNGDCPSWVGLMLLGVRPDTVAAKTVSFNWWNWDPSGALPETPATDSQRWLALGNGSIDATRGIEAPNNDPVQLLSVGPLGTGSFVGGDGRTHWILEPGDTLQVSFALLGGRPSPDAEPPRTAEEDIAYNAQWAQTAFDLNFRIPVPPPSPNLRVVNSHERITLWWNDSPLRFLDPRSHEQDFEGFRVYVSERGKAEGFRLLRDIDLVDSLGYDTGLAEITAPEPLLVPAGEDTLRYPFRFVLDQVRDGFKYWVSVTSYDTGTNEIDPLESGIAQNRTFTIPGVQRGEAGAGRVIVFPNPYHGDAAWDEALLRDRYIWFAGLPQRCTIRIYTLAGDLVQTIPFDALTYGATNVRGIYDPDDVWNPAREIPKLSGAMAAWDLTTRKDQAIASGLYIFSVEDAATGEVERGSFVILK
jgi:hypothetical protein